MVRGPERFPQEERLTRKADYQRIYETGEKRMGNAFILFTLRQPGHGRKLGCAVSRKVGGAVVRNRVKRYIRETYRRLRAVLAEDVYLVVVARPKAVDLDSAACADEIRRLFQKGDLLGG